MAIRSNVVITGRRVATGAELGFGHATHARFVGSGDTGGEKHERENLLHGVRLASASALKIGPQLEW